MLVLTRKKDERIRIGTDVEIVVIEARNGKVRLGIDAPRDVLVLRDELEVTVPSPEPPTPTRSVPDAA